MAVIYPEDFFRELFEKGLLDNEGVPYIVDNDGNVIFLDDDTREDDSGW